MKRMACVFALAAGTGLTGLTALPALAAPNPATAVSGLQVNIVPPGTVSTDSVIPLDVKFHGGNIRIIELFIDGTRLTRQALSTRDGHGAVHFTIDPSLLSEGSHEVLVKAYEADGTCATTTTQISVASGDINALAKFEWPKRNSEVQGIVPIRVKIDPSITEPYVTFTVDNDFLAFRNYAPYVYNWDSAKATNGLHTIGIEVMDGKTLQIVQKLTLQINVKNVGGFTNVQPPVSRSGKVETGSIAETIEGIAESVAPDSDLSAQDSVPTVARTKAEATLSSVHRIGAPVEAASRFRAATSLSVPGSVSPLFTNPTNGLPGDKTELFTGNGPVFHTKHVTRASRRTNAFSPAGIAAPVDHAPAIAPNGPHIAPGLSVLAAEPLALMPSAKTTFGLARQVVHFRRMGGIALRPGIERRAVSSVPTMFHAVSKAPAIRSASSHGPISVGLPGFTKTSMKTFDVMFNNTLVNFDVPPRVENGLPLAPFRAIFEHNGGVVKWSNNDKVVRAADTDRNIEIHIGSKEAKVNNHPLIMEATPYLDRGRTIVPLSFIRDSMDVKVTFDPETGHLLIEKK